MSERSNQQGRKEALEWLASARRFDDLMKRLHGCRVRDERRGDSR